MVSIEKSTGYFTSFDGSSIYYEIRGQGQPIVFTYGLACLINHFHPQLQYFSKNFQTIIFDYRGHHKSPMPKDKNSLTIDSLSKDLELLLEHLKIEKAHFVGHSFGAQVLLKSYSLFSEKFLSMTFINGFSHNPIKDMFGLNIVQPTINFLQEAHKNAPYLSTTLWKLAVNNPLAIGISALAGGFNIQLTKMKDIEIYAKGVASLDIDVFTAFFREVARYDGRPVLKSIKTPTLIISGHKDSVTPQRYQQRLHQEITNSEFLLVPYGSHCTQLDFPELVNLRIEKFLRDHL